MTPTAPRPTRPIPPIHTATDLAHLTPTQRATRERALEATALSRREHRPLTEAAHRAGTTPTTVRRYARSAWRRKGRTWAPTARDSQLRRMRFPVAEPTPDIVYVDVPNSRAASAVGRYWDAVRLWARTGDASALVASRGKALRIGDRRLPYVTDEDVLHDLADAGVLSFDVLYQDVWT